MITNKNTVKTVIPQAGAQKNGIIDLADLDFKLKDNTWYHVCYEIKDGKYFDIRIWEKNDYH